MFEIFWWNFGTLMCATGHNKEEVKKSVNGF